MIINEIKCNNIRLLKVSGGGASNELLEELAGYAIKEGFANQGYVQALLKREEEYPTGIQAIWGIAIPHADQQFTKQGTIIMAMLEHGTEFREMASRETMQVEMVFLLLIQNTSNQVKVLENIVALIQDEDKMNSLRSSAAMATLENVFEAYA